MAGVTEFKAALLVYSELLEAFADLRDAGVAPQHLPVSHRELRELYERVEAALERLKREP